MARGVLGMELPAARGQRAGKTLGGIMGRPYTSGIWTVKPGREEDFVARWRELAEWASVEFPGAERPTLLRDMDQPHRFVSFGAWQDLEQIEAFRRHAEFARHVARIQEVLDDFTPVTYEAVIAP